MEAMQMTQNSNKPRVSARTPLEYVRAWWHDALIAGRQIEPEQQEGMIALYDFSGGEEWKHWVRPQALQAAFLFWCEQNKVTDHQTLNQSVSKFGVLFRKIDTEMRSSRQRVQITDENDERLNYRNIQTVYRFNILPAHREAFVKEGFQP